MIETEQFDVVAEIAIEALGKLGDQRAVPALQAIAGDGSRDRYVREAARKSLRQLGAAGKAPADTKTPRAPPEPDRPAPAADLGAGLGGARADVPDGPTFESDVLGATERLTFAVGAARLQYDTARERPSFDGDLAARYERTHDTPSRGIRYGGDGALVAGVVDYPGDGSSSRAAVLAAGGDAEARFYVSGGELYGLVQGAAQLSFAYNRTVYSGPTFVNNKRFNADLHAGIGVGRGRVLEVGEALRLRRIEKVLEDARMLGRPITGDLAERVLRTWWALRDEQGAHRRLTATVAILREAGVLLGEPDASTTYKILQVLLDGQLDRRPSGLDVRLAVAESYLIRDSDTNLEDGRIETLLVAARYGQQTATGEHELVGEAFARYRILGDDGDPTPWAAAASAAWRRYAYSEHFDPIGALEIAGQVGASKDGFDSSRVATRVAGRVGWLWSPNRASRFRLAGHLALESGTLFVGATFEAVYGLLDVGYVGASTYSALGE
jgi:hypothetical protein